VEFLRKAIQGRVGRFVAHALVRCSPDSIEGLLGVLKVVSRGKRNKDGFIENMMWSSHERDWGWAALEVFGEGPQDKQPRLVSPEDAVFLIAVARSEPFLLLYYRQSDFGSGFSRYAVKRLRKMAARYREVLGRACQPAGHPQGLTKYWPDDLDLRPRKATEACGTQSTILPEDAPPILSPQQMQDWQQLLKAAAEDRLMAVRMPRVSDEKLLAVVCSVTRDGPDVTFRPLALMFDGDSERLLGR
jgi:hypothetical protein